MDLGMKTDKIALDGYDFMSRPKAGSASCYSKKKKKDLTYLCQTAQTYWQSSECKNAADFCRIVWAVKHLQPSARLSNTRSDTLCQTALYPRLALEGI